MTRKELLYITGSYYRNMGKHISGIKDGMNEEAIHQFRVEYKKLRAFFRLLSTLPGSQKLKAAKKLKQLYTISGEIRDLQLEQQRIRNALADKKQVEAHCTTLQQMINALEPSLKNQLSKAPVSVNNKKTKNRLPDQFTLHDFRRFARLQWTDIKAILRSGISKDDHLHAIRKHYKDLYYNLKIYKGAEYRLLHKSVLRKMTGNEVKILLDELGDFQDRSTSLSLLKTHWLNSYGIATHLLLCNIQQEWISDHKQHYRDLVKKMKTLSAE